MAFGMSSYVFSKLKIVNILYVERDINRTVVNGMNRDDQHTRITWSAAVDFFRYKLLLSPLPAFL